MKHLLISLTISLAPLAQGLELVSAAGMKREFAYDGRVWRTVSFGDLLPVASDEFHIRTMDDREWTVDDYRSAGEPERIREGLIFRYVWPKEASDRRMLRRR